MRIIRFAVGLALLPCCVAVTRTLLFMISHLGISFQQPPAPPVFCLLAGFFAWLAVFALLPKPTRAYVLAHELSHALWGSMFDARVSGLKISKAGGHVKLSKHNFIVVLAPYFFPFYTVMAILAYWLASVFINAQKFYLVLLASIGFTMGFHFIFTLDALSRRQSDIREYGSVFSYPLIYFLCIFETTVLLAIVSPFASFSLFWDRFAADMAGAWAWCWSITLVFLNLCNK